MVPYYVNKNAQRNGDHEVHAWKCENLPDTANRIYLGNFENCRGAVQKARDHFDQVNGCAHCAADCHTG